MDELLIFIGVPFLYYFDMSLLICLRCSSVRPFIDPSARPLNDCLLNHNEYLDDKVSQSMPLTAALYAQPTHTNLFHWNQIFFLNKIHQAVVV